MQWCLLSTLVQEINVTRPLYSMIENEVKAHDFKINCGTTKVWLLVKVQHLQVNTVIAKY